MVSSFNGSAADSLQSWNQAQRLAQLIDRRSILDERGAMSGFSVAFHRLNIDQHTGLARRPFLWWAHPVCSGHCSDVGAAHPVPFVVDTRAEVHVPVARRIVYDYGGRDIGRSGKSCSRMSV